MSHPFWEGSGPHLGRGVAGRAGKLKPQDCVGNREGNGEAVAERSQALRDSRSLARKEERVRWSSTGAGVAHLDPASSLLALGRGQSLGPQTPPVKMT